jgi:hypothetical protein
VAKIFEVHLTCWVQKIASRAGSRGGNQGYNEPSYGWMITIQCGSCLQFGTKMSMCISLCWVEEIRMRGCEEEDEEFRTNENV